MDLIIKNGKVITESEIYEADIGVKEGKIIQISKTISEQANRVVDASGKLVIPGLVDGHTHFEMPFMGTTTADDFESGTISATCGGVTTIVDFALQGKGQTLLQAIEVWRKKADPKVCADYSLHVAIREFVPGQIENAIKYGVPSFKVFMIYKKEGLWLDDGSMYMAMKEASQHGGLVGVHCENADLSECFQSEYLKQGKTSAEYHAKAKPPAVEAEAIQRAITLAELAKANMYVVHMSTGLGVELVKAAMSRGLPVFAETCPHYLVFTEEAYLRKDGRNYILSPPLRPKEDRDKLWQGLQEGIIKTVASDHAAFTTQQKDLGKDDFTKVPNGGHGTEIILPILYSFGVRRDILSLNRLVQSTSYNPAKAYGLLPEKGIIAVGSDADLVVFDPKKKVKLTKENLHGKLDHSLYSDITVTGYPVVTVCRGEVVHEDGQFVGKTGRGRFVKGKSYPTGRLTYSMFDF